MNDITKRKQIKLIFGSLAALLFVGFMLVFALVVDQNYTVQEHNGTLKTLSEERTVMQVESGVTSWCDWEEGETPEPSAWL